MKLNFKLDKRTKRKWVNALRSGKFKQGEQQLRSIDEYNEQTYCCLGVACALGIAKPKTGWTGEYVKDDFLPVEIQLKLAAWNDGFEMSLNQDSEPVNSARVKKTFRGIATWIEKYL